MDVKVHDFAKAHLLSLFVLGDKEGKLGLEKKEFTGEKGKLLVKAKREKILWVETPKNKSLLGKSIFGLEEEEEGDLKRRNEFHLHSSPFFLFFFIFMVVFLPSMN